MAADQEMRAVVERIEILVEKFARSSDPGVREQAQQLVRLLMRLYGEGLKRILAIVELHAGRDAPMMRALLNDELVASLLVLHDLHPEDAETRIRRGLEQLGESARASISLVQVRHGTARVRLDDSSGSASASDLGSMAESVVRALAPEIGVVEMEGFRDSATASLLTQIQRRSPGGQPIERSVR